MKNYIVSDLHGNGNIYDSIMAYLENVSNSINDDITLYINGDLIDRGEDSARMLIDIKKRVHDNPFKIEYLAGNHELMMYQASLKMKNGVFPPHSNWMLFNGGSYTAYGLEDLVSYEEELDIINFISNLKIYHKFDELLDGKQIVLVHAKCPKIVEEDCPLKVSDNDRKVEKLVWTRKEDIFIPYKSKIGNPDYFTIIGHTPVDNKFGYKYYPSENYLNIDGGCAGYVIGQLEYDHTPLVEVDSANNRLIILTFNNKNEIIYGNYFTSGISIPINEEQLNNYRKYINHNVKVKKYTGV